MDNFTREVLTWFARKYAGSVPGLSEQIAVTAVGSTAFTHGGGAFIRLHLNRACPPVILGGPSVVALEGPEIRAPELEHGALATLFVRENGELDFIEVWSYAGDYPADRHPVDFSLHEPKINYVDLRREL